MKRRKKFRVYDDAGVNMTPVPISKSKFK